MPASDSNTKPIHLAFVLGSAAVVFIAAHWDALTNQYVINDDVRQQVAWMQLWTDPELFRDDLLTRYAWFYVPWGVQAVYWIGSWFVNPVQFSKVVTGLLFVLNAGLIYGLALQFRKDLTAVYAACLGFFFSSFLRKISGGLAAGFAYPLLLAYLFFLARGSLLPAGIMILLASVLNPYIFLLCLVTHAIYLSWNYGPAAIRTIRNGMDRTALKRAALNVTPVIAGVMLMALKYVFLKPAEFGDVVSWSEMAGKIEYTAVGRVEIVPVPSVFFEFLRPWLDLFAVRDFGVAWGAVGMAGILALALFGALRREKVTDPAGLRVFAYLLPASLLLYAVSYSVLMKLFLPERYLELSLNVFYCLALAACASEFGEAVRLRRLAFPFLACCGVFLAALRLHQVGIYDYGADARLYRFLHTTPKNALVAGHPELMDNTLTFGQRKALVTYELSHTWMNGYWPVIKQRTYDLFRAYYSDDPEEVRVFCNKYGIDYFVVRDEDYTPARLASGGIYFQPFGAAIAEMVRHRSRFVLMDRKLFPPVYEFDGIRVIATARPEPGHERRLKAGRIRAESTGHAP